MNMTTGIIYNYAGSTVNSTMSLYMYSQIKKSFMQTQQIWMSLVAHSLSDQPSAVLDLGNYSQPFLMSQFRTHNQC